MRGWIIPIEPGTQLPRGYGRAWYDFSRDVNYAMPLGINVVAGALRALYYRVLRGWPESRRADAAMVMSRDAYLRGAREGRERGYTEGWNDCMRRWHQAM